MLLGRRPYFWIGLVAAALNLGVIVFAVPLTPEGVAACNGFAVALVALLANSSDPTTAGSFELTTHPPVATAVALPSGRASSPTDPMASSDGSVTGPTAGPTGGGG